jgi:hypothetical protein
MRPSPAVIRNKCENFFLLLAINLIEPSRIAETD